MRQILLLFVFIALSASVVASAQETVLLANQGHELAYVTVVPEDGPVTNIVNAANFAASMKGSVATTFTALLDTDARIYYTQSGLENSVVVIFDGTGATILKGLREEFNRVEEGARIYLERQGFSVSVKGPDLKELGIVEKIEEQKLGTDSPAPSENDAAPLPEPFQEPTYEPQNVPAEDEPEEPLEIEEPPEDKPNVIVRIWRWFANLLR